MKLPTYLLAVLGLAGCVDDGTQTSATEQDINFSQPPAALTINGIPTNISYGLVDLPISDKVGVGLSFTPSSRVVRVSEYRGQALGRTTVVSEADPPGEVTADPPGGVDPPDPDLNFAIYNGRGSLVTRVKADPPAERTPDAVTLRVTLLSTSSVRVYDATGRLLGTVSLR